MKNIAFVIPWYGLEIPGGSEAACRNIAERMVSRGVHVDILTTCVKDFYSDWSTNFHRPGKEQLNGVNVIRFKVRKRNTAEFDQINKRLMFSETISYEEEQIYLKESVNSPDLELYLKENRLNYRAIIFTPYMFGTTYHGVSNALDRAVLFPAFHDESYAYFISFKELYSQVRGIIFNSDAEKEWAEEVYNLSHVKTRVIGLGIKDFSFNSERFISKYNIKDPFILYAGRKDAGKNVNLLVDYFTRYHMNQKSNLKLVLIGGGNIDIPPSAQDHVIDLGFVEEQDKYDAYSAATFFCNPSAFESFSIVIMESWHCARPILVYEDCSVTKRFAEISNGGLYFKSYPEFEACVKILSENSVLCNKLGQNGQMFVKARFQWEQVITNYLQFIDECFKGNE